MKRNEIITKLQNIRNGAYTKITFISDICSNKDNKGHKVQKVVSAVCRLGVQYSHIQVAMIQSRPIDASSSRDRLPWGEWDIDCPYLINHKDNSYLRCTVSRSPNHHRKVTYMVDGVEVTKEEAMLYTRPSEWVTKEEYVYNPKIENILSIGKEAA